MFRLRGMTAGTFVRAVARGIGSPRWPRHLFLCVADHFEPDWNGASESRRRDRVARWVRDYPRRFGGHVDSRGRPPQHTFFYPAEVYDPGDVEPLCDLVRAGFGDVEVHLHHDDDTSQRLEAFLTEYTRTLHERHGLLSRDGGGSLRYGFVHGNWALDNSHPGGRWCGVNDELSVLARTGCYADFTFPAAPHPAQPRTINQIYYAIDDPGRPKSHDTGVRAALGREPPAGSLLLIPGPLIVTTGWRRRPRVENGNLSGSQPPDPRRIENWVRAGVGVAGRDDWLFVKLHTHGAAEKNADVLLGDPMSRFHAGLGEAARSHGFAYYYVTAREMAQLVAQARDGMERPEFDRLGWGDRPNERSC